MRQRRRIPRPRGRYAVSRCAAFRCVVVSCAAVLCAVFLYAAFPMPEGCPALLSVCAAGYEEEPEAGGEEPPSAEEMIGEYDFGELDRELKELFPEERLDFGEALIGIISGDTAFTAEFLKRLVSDRLFYALRSCRENLVHILAIAVIAALFSSFSEVFRNRQISETGFYILYLLLIALCLNSFQTVLSWVEEGIGNLTAFMGVFCPIYFLAVTAAKGSVSAAAFYNIVLLLIFLTEALILHILLPAVHVCMMVKVLDLLSEEEYLSKLAELIETGVSWALKTLLACVIGMNLIQGLISPAIDAVKRSAVTRGAEAIPGIGDAIGGAAEVVLGTAVLVKNGIGVTGAVICFALCIHPLVQIGCIALMYKLAAAVLQPISDRRVIGCVESVGDGCRLLMRTVFTAGLLFLLTIVIVSAATGRI